MSVIKKMFEGHVKFIKGLALEKDIPFLRLLRNLCGKSQLVFLVMDLSDKRNERKLIEMYRLLFYEKQANDSIELLSKNWKTIIGRPRGGKMRAESLARQGLETESKIAAEEMRLMQDGTPLRHFNNVISKNLKLNTDYVRKVRTKLRKRT